MKTINLKIADILEKKNITRYELAKRTKIKFQTIDRYYKNEVTRYDKYILMKICLALDCNISDILKIDETV